MSKKIAFNKPPEPPFIRRMKEQIGYKEGPDVDTKRQALEAASEEDCRDRDEELPTVVQLKEGDLSQDEAHGLLKTQKEEEEAPADGRILFKKPVKRTSEGAEVDTSKKIKRSGKPIKNKTLLSFEDDDGEEDEEEEEQKEKERQREKAKEKKRKVEVEKNIKWFDDDDDENDDIR